MKKFLLINVLFVLSVSMLKAQTNQGKMLVGVSSSLSLAGAGSDLMSFGYSTSKDKSDASGFQETDPDKTISCNILPKVGYFVVDNLALGVDIAFALSKSEYNSSMSQSKSTTTLFSIGPFARYYIPTGKVLPFFELGGSVGSGKNKYSYSSTTGEVKSGLLSFGGGLGIATSLGERATFDVMLGYNSLRVKAKEDNPDNERTVNGTFGLKLGFVIFLGAN